MNLRGRHSAPEGGIVSGGRTRTAVSGQRSSPRLQKLGSTVGVTQCSFSEPSKAVRWLGVGGGGTGGRRRRRGADHVREPSRVRAARSCPLPWSCYAGLSTLFRGLYKQPLRRMLHLKEYLQTSAFRLQNPFGISRTTALSAESRRVEDKWPGAAYLGLPLPS